MRLFKPTCRAKTRRGTACKCKPVPGKRRCRFHGGLSTGPKTPEGRAQSAVNLRKALAAINANTPEAAEARRRRAATGAATRAKNRKRAENEARWREWCRGNRIDPVTCKPIPRLP
ncbi:HGGxSTG domain-containing protein [uncultured Lamprocystis sp.]|uniref:HGGxSTG domain-containing protein n=1 Tax=uncultured Lamprocystis sp. TaxID=543132 RepID=UPI00342B6975